MVDLRGLVTGDRKIIVALLVAVAVIFMTMYTTHAEISEDVTGTSTTATTVTPSTTTTTPPSQLTAKLIVKVTDKYGNPLSGAVVDVNGEKKVTDVTGTTTFTVYREATYDVHVEKIGYNPATTQVYIPVDEDEVTITISLEPEITITVPTTTPPPTPPVITGSVKMSLLTPDGEVIKQSLIEMAVVVERKPLKFLKIEFNLNNPVNYVLMIQITGLEVERDPETGRLVEKTELWRTIYYTYGKTADDVLLVDLEDVLKNEEDGTYIISCVLELRNIDFYKAVSIGAKIDKEYSKLYVIRYILYSEEVTPIVDGTTIYFPYTTAVLVHFPRYARSLDDALNAIEVIEGTFDRAIYDESGLVKALVIKTADPIKPHVKLKINEDKLNLYTEWIKFWIWPLTFVRIQTGPNIWDIDIVQKWIHVAYYTPETGIVLTFNPGGNWEIGVTPTP